MYRISVVAIDDDKKGGAPIAELLDGRRAGVPEDSGGPMILASKLSRLVGSLMYGAPATDERDPKDVPGTVEWWGLLNDEFRMKNATSVVYDPAAFDVKATRDELARALASRLRKQKHAIRSFVQHDMHTGVPRMDKG